MKVKRKHSFVHGAIILTVATVVVKIVGMFYKIPLGNILGAAGMSYFMTAYSIFNPFYALSVAGFPVAVSKLVSESAAQGRYRDVKRIFRVGFGLFVITGLVGFVAMFAGAGIFSGMVGNPDARIAVAAMAPAIFFCCIMSAYRGYFQGLSDMSPTAFSQVVESVAKLACGIAFAYYFLRNGLSQYAATGYVYGVPASSMGQAELVVLPYAAAGATLGVTASTAVGALYMFVRSLVKGDGLPAQLVEHSPAPQQSARILKRLVLIALPVCLASVLTQVTTLIDVATIINRVGVAMQRDSGTVLAMYQGLFLPELTQSGVPSYLYGAYGYTTSIFNLVPSMTIALGISALPVISSNWALGGKGQVAVQVRSVIKLTALFAIPAGLGIAALAEPILSLLYPARVQEVAIAAPILRSMGVAAVLVGIATPLSSIFQAIGRADIPVKLMAVGALLKFAANYTLIAIPALNITAAPYGTILCYAFILAASLYYLQKCVGGGNKFASVLVGPLICGIICAVAAHTSYVILYRLYPSRLICLASVALGGSIYLIFVLFLRILTKNEIFMLPGGKKIAKILEKRAFLR